MRLLRDRGQVGCLGDVGGWRPSLLRVEAVASRLEAIGRNERRFSGVLVLWASSFGLRTEPCSLRTGRSWPYERSPAIA